MLLGTIARRVAPAIASLLLVGGIATCMPASSAYADDIMPLTSEDQGYFFTFKYFGDSQHSERASKDDATASYIYVNHMTIYDVHLYVDGYWNGSWNFNMTRGGYAYLVDPGQWWIHNYVYENGYPEAQLRGLASEAGELGGLWSPDSWGTYNSLN